jgi:8-oxo-dGTP diphosphatase
MEDLVCFVGQKAFIEKDGKLLILHDPLMGLDMPGGKIIEGETDIVTSLKREVREETGLEITVGRPFVSWFFTIPLDSGHRSAGKKIFTIAYRCTYVSGEVTLSSEHDWYQWVTKENYRQYIEKENNFTRALVNYFETIVG